MHDRSIVARLAAAALFAASLARPAAAEIVLVAPTELDAEVKDVRDALADPVAQPTELHFEATQMFEQAQNTHHLPVSGIGEWKKPERMHVAGEVTAQDAVRHFKGLLIREPPPVTVQAKEVRNRLVADYLTLRDMAADGAIRKAQDGELEDGVVAAYVWDVAKAAKDGAIEGIMLAQPALIRGADVLGEFILATIGAHEMRHRVTHEQNAQKLADEVKDSEVEAFFDEGAIMQLIDPDGEKFMYLWMQTVEKPGTPAFVREYVKHLARVRHAYSKGRSGIQQLVEELPYEDRPGFFHSHRCAPDHDHSKDGSAPDPSKT